MKSFTKVVVLLAILTMLVGVVPFVAAQDIESICLITDVGRINDGGFNQNSWEGVLLAEDEFDLETTFIETQSETDYEANINTCVEEGFDIIVTVGFLIEDATTVAAGENPDIFFLGIDQDFSDNEATPENVAGILFVEDEASFLAGALAAKVAEMEGSNTIAGVYGIDIPPVKRLRNGYEQGALYINPDINILGVYIPDFIAPDLGASAAEQFIGEGASVIFGAGGPTGSGGITAAAQQDVWVIGVDKDEYTSTFGNGETPGSEFLITSALKRLDQGVLNAVTILVEGDMDAFPGGGNFVFGAEDGGVGLAPKHDADVPDELYDEVNEILEMLIAGDISTGVDFASGDLADDMGDMDDMEDDMDDMEDEDMSDDGEDMDDSDDGEDDSDS